MAEVSAEVLSDLMSALQNGQTFIQYIRENNLQETVRPNELRQQFIASFGQETLRDIMQNTMFTRISNRWVTIASRMNNVDKIDQMIVALNGAIATLETRKSELQ